MPVIPTRASAAVPTPNFVILPKTISISIYEGTDTQHNRIYLDSKEFQLIRSIPDKV